MRCMEKASIIPIERLWFTTKDCQKYLGVSRGFIDDLRESGKLSYYKVGHTIFVKKKDLDRLIEQGKVI